MTPLIEQIARAIYEADDPWHEAFPWPNPDGLGAAANYRRIATAILPIITAALDARQEQDAAIAENSDCSPSYERSEWYGGYECGFYRAYATIATAIRSAPHAQ